MEFLAEYGLFLAKVVTVVIALVIIVSSVAGASQKSKQAEKGHLEITPLNQQFNDMSEAMLIATMDEAVQKAEEKKLHKAKKKQAKLDKKHSKKANKTTEEAEETPPKSRVFVLNFNGNISASATSHLREEVTAVLTQATANDEVLVKLESPGG
ncbi:MAG: protease SohB, partial [Porticoccaceae bacterium]